MSETKRRAKYTLEFKMEEVCSVRQECNDPRVYGLLCKRGCDQSLGILPSN